jgi:mannose-6-phosphate isomerase-like protein (cupin superfamily)
MNNDIELPKFQISNNGDPDIQLACVSNMYVRMMHFRHAGDVEHGHSHPFDHMTLLAEGSMTVEVDGVSRDFYAPKMIFIKKDREHQLTATRDNTVAFCIHPLRDGERVEDIVDPDSYVIPPGAAGIDYLEQHHSDLLDSIVGSKLNIK